MNIFAGATSATVPHATLHVSCVRVVRRVVEVLTHLSFLHMCPGCLRGRPPEWLRHPKMVRTEVEGSDWGTAQALSCPGCHAIKLPRFHPPLPPHLSPPDNPLCMGSGNLECCCARHACDPPSIGSGTPKPVVFFWFRPCGVSVRAQQVSADRSRSSW